MSTGTDAPINQYLLILLHLIAARFQISHNKQQSHLPRHGWGSLFHVKMDNQRTSDKTLTILQQRIDGTPKETNTQCSCVADRLLIVKSLLFVLFKEERSKTSAEFSKYASTHPQIIFMINGLCVRPQKTS